MINIYIYILYIITVEDSFLLHFFSVVLTHRKETLKKVFCVWCQI